MSKVKVGRSRRRRSRWATVPCGFVAATLVLASAAWACTVTMPTLTLSPNSGRPGSSTTGTVAKGLKPLATYKMNFINNTNYKAGVSCHKITQVLATVQADGAGGFKVTMAIPANAPRGTSKICGVESFPSAGATATTHTTYTVL